MEIKLSKDNFNEVVANSDKPVLIDFWATWCGPCKMIAPVIEQVAKEREDIKVCKVNVDEEEELAVKFGIQSIPTLVLVKNGEIAGKAVGYRDYNGVCEFIDAN
jgi:thioredoxin 1